MYIAMKRLPGFKTLLWVNLFFKNPLDSYTSQPEMEFSTNLHTRVLELAYQSFCHKRCHTWQANVEWGVGEVACHSNKNSLSTLSESVSKLLLALTLLHFTQLSTAVKLLLSC